MGDLKDLYNDMKEDRKEKHDKWFHENMIFLEVNLPERFTLKGTVCLFREKGFPKVDFYPHTGRWKQGNKVFKGGAISFVNWYKKLKRSTI